jgi:DNA primase
MLRQSQLISLLDRALHQSARIRKGNEAVYYCPFCHHYKKKLEINVDTEEWHCWVCHAAGRRIRTFFRKLRVHGSFYDELYKITGNRPLPKQEEEDVDEKVYLPNEFLPLSIPTKSFQYLNAINYLKKRGVTREDILRYNIGYCEDGEYKNRVIVPSYDKDGNVNFFSARAYYENTYMKYMLPPWSKNIIGFELFINWDEPITICEGAFDAMAIRKNAIPLFGTTMSVALKEAIVEHGVKRINVVLDNDALKSALRIYDYIERIKSTNVEVFLIKLDDKDPSILGFKKINHIIDELSEPMGFANMVKMKLNL